MKFIVKLLTNIIFYSNKIFNFVEVREAKLLKIISVLYDANMRTYKIRLQNDASLEGVQIFEAI